MIRGIHSVDVEELPLDSGKIGNAVDAKQVPEVVSDMSAKKEVAT